jgi:precorrin-6B methylase 2
MHKSIAYQTDRLASYFSNNRVTWEQFYESERIVISQLGLSKGSTVLDIGCGCGGLGLALRDQFGTNIYSGVEINPQAAEAAGKLNPSAMIYQGDFLDLSQAALCDTNYDAVFSLSCFDWNIQFDRMLAAAWKHVAAGGVLVATFRLVSNEGCNDITKSYQYINFDGVMEGERAAYVVLNAKELLFKLVALMPSTIAAFGYFGSPSSTAVTPYENLCFSAFSIKKRKDGDRECVKFDLNLPKDIYSSLELSQQ